MRAQKTGHEKFSCMCSLQASWSNVTLMKPMFIGILFTRLCETSSRYAFKVYSQGLKRTKKVNISSTVSFDQFNIIFKPLATIITTILLWYNITIISLSSGLTWRTAMPAAPDAVHPPHVLKYSMPPPEKDVAYSCVVTTAPIGKPFPIGLPRVTISGTTPYISNAQKWLPTLPKPTCTSSAIQAAPSSLIALYTASRYPSGRMICNQRVVR